MCKKPLLERPGNRLTGKTSWTDVTFLSEEAIPLLQSLEHERVSQSQEQINISYSFQRNSDVRNWKIDGISGVLIRTLWKIRKQGTEFSGRISIRIRLGECRFPGMQNSVSYLTYCTFVS